MNCYNMSFTICGIHNIKITISQSKEFFLYNRALYNFFAQRLILRQLAPFDWKFPKIGTLRAKDLRKNVPILQERGFTPAPWTLLVIRVVLFQWLYGVSNPFCPQLYIKSVRTVHAMHDTKLLKYKV